MLQKILALTAVLVLVGTARAQEWGDLEGTFLFKGTPPTPKKVVVDKDQQYCGPHNPVDESIVVNKDNNGLANVVVYLNDPPPAKPKIHPDYEKDAKAEVIVDNEK